MTTELERGIITVELNWLAVEMSLHTVKENAEALVVATSRRLD
jgi:hypothetical protein